MNIGFDTIGNATVIVYDDKPVIATDPWIVGGAYFGSWRMSHKIPTEQMEAVKNCEYIWFSHGHPDHLNPDSLPLFINQKILLPDHVGERIKKDLEEQGFKVQILPNKKWFSVSPKVRVMCICDYYQDAIILIDVNGRLIINTNDAIDRGWGRFARNVAKPFKTRFLLSLFGHGDADMINFYDENSKYILPKAAKKLPVGANMAQTTESWGAKFCIPFSSMHRYQRTDSIWANEYTTHLDDYAIGYESKTSELLPAYIRYDCETDEITKINPPEEENIIYEPEHFGDNWSEELSAEDAQKATAYFQKIEHLKTFLDFINVKVGGKDNIVPLAKDKFKRGLTFEVPKGSLMSAIEWRVFDDLLIGNFMKTTLHGKWSKSQLYPEFTPYVARYSDNANVHHKEELERYFEEYRQRAPMEFLWNQFESKAIDMFRSRIEGGSKTFQASKKFYWYFKKMWT
ncbi:MAG: MBL fold metallo-hydrolase [Pyrinomonadaceae bacterium]